MNKVIVILFSAYYMIASVGVDVNIHYCGGEISALNISSDNGLCCCEGDADMDMSGCCDDESLFFQIDNDQYFSQSSRVSFEQKFTLIALSYVLADEFCLTSREVSEFQYFDLPPPEKPPRWLQNCSLVYYG